MNRTSKMMSLAVFIVLMTSVSIFGQNYKIDAGERIRVRIEDKITSKTSKTGDRFVTKGYGTGLFRLRTNCNAERKHGFGSIDEVTPAKKGGDPGQIEVSFVEIATSERSSQSRSTVHLQVSIPTTPKATTKGRLPATR